jgi:hypothetical protein
VLTRGAAQRKPQIPYHDHRRFARAYMNH